MRHILSQIRHTLIKIHPAKLVFLGYLSYIVLGWLALCIPIVQKMPGVKSLDSLFIATSAVSTTGLCTVSIFDNYNFIGQLIVLLLIQLGGIGYMTVGSFVILSRKIPLSDFRTSVGATVFSLPANFQLDKFVASVIKFTVAIELAGAAILFVIFSRAGVANAAWSAIFHSVSSFCTAGFGLYNNSFEDFKLDFWLNITIAALSYLGAVGFIVCVDVWRLVRGKIESVTLTSKIILWSTLWLSLIGTTVLFINEPSIQSVSIDKRLLMAFFQTMTSMTTVGFNTIGIGALSRASLLLIIVLMVIGASPSGTGGGLKSTTFTAVLGVMRSAMRGENEVKFWGRIVPLERVWTAIAGLGFYLITLVIGTYLLELTETAGFAENLFEAASALGTVGLSMGITPMLTTMGKVIIIFLMFCGRLGPLTFGMALFFHKVPETDSADGDLAI